MTEDMISDLLHGKTCQECARPFLEGEPGYPRTCDDCRPASARRPPRNAIGGKTKEISP